MDPRRPVTDADRETAVAALRHHAGAGAIDLDEFGDRTAAVLAAPTVADLEAVFADLPGGGRAPAVRDEVGPTHSVRPWWFVPLVPLAILFVAVWALTGFGYFWPVWPILGLSIGALRRGACWGHRAGWA